VSGEFTWLSWTLVALAAIAVLAIWWIRRRGRPFMTGDVFRASRLSSGNRLFPTQVAITPTSVVQYKPRWFGKQEQTIHIAHVASVNINTGLLLSNVLIETSGGSDPIACHGHRKADAVKMKELIERYQTAHYREFGPPGAAPGPVAGRPVDPKPIGR
jgi:hypothetical protein